MSSSGIGTLNEGSLHASLKQLLAVPGDRFEQNIEGFVVDIVRGETLIEIQTRSFGAMGRKLDVLLDSYRVRIVHPVLELTYLNRPTSKPRRSPKKGSRFSVLDELVSIPALLDHPNFTLEVLLVTVDAIQIHDRSMKRGRGGWRVVDRRLRSINSRLLLSGVEDLMSWLPGGLPQPFTNAELADLAGITIDQARKLTYCLRASDRLVLVDHTRRGHHYLTVGAPG